MSGQIATALFYGLMLLLPLSALIARRMPVGTTLKMALIWVAIIVAGLLLVAQRDRIAPAWAAASGLLLGSDQRVTGNTVHVRMASDGHFWVSAEINGVRRRMLVDSGASTTALSSATARAARIVPDDSPFPVMIDTANGQVTARLATAERLSIGAIDARDLPVVVADAFGDTDVIGMNFLSRLAAWRVEGRTLILQPQ